MDTTIHSAGIGEIHMVPMSVIQRPIPSVLDEKKVQSLMETIKVGASTSNKIGYRVHGIYQDKVKGAKYACKPRIRILTFKFIMQGS